MTDEKQSEPIRVALLTSSPTPYKNPLIERLARHQSLSLVVYFCVWKSGTRPWQLKPLDGVVYQVLSGIHIPVGLGNYVRINFAIIPKLWKRKPDIVVISGYNHPTMLMAILYCWFFRVPYLIQAETWKRSRRRLSKIKEWLIHPFLRCSSGFLVTGSLSKSYWKNVGIDSDQIKVFANTPDVEYFKSACRALCKKKIQEMRDSWQPAERRIGIFVGRLIKEKGIDILLDGLRALPDNLRPLLVLVGDGNCRAEYEKLAEGLPVRFLGFTQNDQLPLLYSAADFFVLTSRKEPWGVVVNEAMACGLPLLLSDQVGAHADLLDTGERSNGVLATGPIVTTVAESLGRFSSFSDSELLQLGNRSEEIVSNWTYEYSVTNFVDLCKQASKR